MFFSQGKVQTPQPPRFLEPDHKRICWRRRSKVVRGNEDSEGGSKSLPEKES